jgi:hypothetical protein
LNKESNQSRTRYLWNNGKSFNIVEGATVWAERDKEIAEEYLLIEEELLIKEILFYPKGDTINSK